MHLFIKYLEKIFLY